MEDVTKDNLIIVLKEKFPNFIPFWESNSFFTDEDLGLHVNMIPFRQYAVKVIQDNDTNEIKRIFDYTEFLINHGDDDVRNVMIVSFLESLLNVEPEDIQFSKFAHFLGKKSKEYCRQWDEFTGHRTKGLWDD